VTTITRTTPIADCPDAMTGPEVAAKLGIKVGLVYKLVERGDIRSVRLGRLIRIPRRELTRLLGADEAGQS
jgi:excisionase family DNA binding protein